MSGALTKYRAILKNDKLLRPFMCLLDYNSSKYSTEPSNQYDIIIAGGGMVGTAFLLALANDTRLSNQRILLLEGGPKHVKKEISGFSNRVSAINRESSQLFKDINVWDKIRRKKSVTDMQIWDACSDASISFNDTLQNEIAYIIENDEILHGLYSTFEENPKENITILNKSKVKNLKLMCKNHLSDRNEVELETGEKFDCKLLIGAEGANSLVRREMGSPYMSWMYGQMGVVATLELEDSAAPNETAWQRFIPGGPIALLPLDTNISSLVWSVPTDRSKQLLGLTDEEFVEELNYFLERQFPQSSLVREANGALRGALRLVGLDSGSMRIVPPRVEAVTARSRAAFPLGFGHSGSYSDSGVAIIGDAAHRVHPLAGQGVNLGFGDVATLATLLGDAVYRGEEIDDRATLQMYETLRQRHAVPTMAAIELLHRLYETDMTPVVLARSIGLQLTNALTPIKKLIMQHAAGSTQVY